MKINGIIVLAVLALSVAGCGMMHGSSSYIGPSLAVENPQSDGGGAVSDPASDPEGSPEAQLSEFIWVSADGDDTNTGSMSSPLRTISKGVAFAVAEGKEVHVVAGQYAETVVIGDASSYYGVRILGGYGALDAGARNRDVGANVVSVDGLLIDGSSGAPRNDIDSLIDGFSLSRLVIKNASPAVNNNIISSGGGKCRGGGVVTIETSAANEARPVLTNNVIENVDCSYGGASPIFAAVEVRALDQSVLAPTFESNRISAGVGASSQADVTLGLVAHAGKSAKVEPLLNNNVIFSGAAAVYSTAVNLWADAPESTANLDMTGNEIRAGQALLSNGVDLGYDGIHDVSAFFNYADIKRNKILGGTESSLATAVSIYNASSVSDIVNNFISAGISKDASAWLSGVYLENADADIVNNTIVADTANIAVLVNLFSANGATNIANNIMYATGAGASFTGIMEQSADSAPALVISNLFDSGLHVIYSSVAGGDILTVADMALIYPSFDPNYSGDALLVDLATMDLHVGAVSTAIDLADQLSAPAVDIDGDLRPQGGGIDIGADEII